MKVWFDRFIIFNGVYISLVLAVSCFIYSIFFIIEDKSDWLFFLIFILICLFWHIVVIKTLNDWKRILTEESPENKKLISLLLNKTDDVE